MRILGPLNLLAFLSQLVVEIVVVAVAVVVVSEVSVQFVALERPCLAPLRLG